MRVREGEREAAAEENICPGGGARVPVHIVTSDHVRVHVTSLLMSCPPHLLMSQLYFIMK